jgi:hypothetical protein
MRLSPERTANPYDYKDFTTLQDSRTYTGTPFALPTTRERPWLALSSRKSGMNPIAEIAATLNAQPVCQQVIHFLLENEAAMDTAKGIATWWVGCDELVVQDALARLIACGVLAAHARTSGTLYGLTRDQELRAWLRSTYGSGGSRAKAVRPHQRGTDSPLLVTDAPANGNTP